MEDGKFPLNVNIIKVSKLEGYLCVLFLPTIEVLLQWNAVK
jgi:hypothetical protein